MACGNIIGVGSLGSSDDASSTVASDDSGNVKDAGPQADAVDAVAVDATANADAPSDAPRPGLAQDADDSYGDASDGGCSGDSGVQWIPWTRTDAPPGAFPVGSQPKTGDDPDAASFEYFVCRAHDATDAGDVVPGVFVDKNGCFYTLDGMHDFQSEDYDVLLDPNACLNWTMYTGDLSGAMVGGELGKVPLYLCTAPLSATEPFFSAGYLESGPDASCWVVAAGGDYQLSLDIFVVTQ